MLYPYQYEMHNEGMSFSRNRHCAKVLSFFVCLSALTLLSVGCSSGLAEAESSPAGSTPEVPDVAATAITGANLVNGPIAFPDGFMKSVKDYGAVGDGAT